ncbi:MAG: putative motility protein [Bacillota bacterium]|nr:putative motility protein [Bacillota bacterium]
MYLSDAIQMQTYSVKQALGMAMLAKEMSQDAEAVQAVMEMASNFSETTGLGRHIDLKA